MVCHVFEALTLLTADQPVSSGKTVDCIVITEGGLRPHNYSIYYLSLKDSLLKAVGGNLFHQFKTEQEQKRREGDVHHNHEINYFFLTHIDRRGKQAHGEVNSDMIL